MKNPPIIVACFVTLFDVTSQVFPGLLLRYHVARKGLATRSVLEYYLGLPSYASRPARFRLALQQLHHKAKASPLRVKGW